METRATTAPARRWGERRARARLRVVAQRARGRGRSTTTGSPAAMRSSRARSFAGRVRAAGAARLDSASSPPGGRCPTRRM